MYLLLYRYRGVPHSTTKVDHQKNSDGKRKEEVKAETESMNTVIQWQMAQSSFNLVVME